MSVQFRRALSGLLATVVTCGVLATTVPAPASAAEPRPKPRPGRDRVVVFVAGDQAEAAVEDARGEGATKRHALLGGVSIGMPAGRAEAVRKRLARYGVTVSEVPERTFADVPNDLEIGSQLSYLDQIDAPEAWNLTHGSPSIRVAVVDSGVKVDHPDLVGKVAASYNAVDGTTNVTDVDGHGTMVAGIAAAATNNAKGLAGTGYDTRLLAVKVEDSEGRMLVDDVAAGIVWAADHGAKVINLSLGGTEPGTVESNAVAYAQTKGAVVVAAAGNGNTSAVSYPAAYPGVLAVGATGPGGTTRASFSNYGSWVDVAAPGVGIRGTTNTGGYAPAAGTSFSAPLVAGAVALIAARAPGTSVTGLVEAVTGSATPLPGEDLGAGLVDMDGAVRYPLPSTVPAFTAPAAGATVSGIQQVTASSTAPLVQLYRGDFAVGSPVAPSSGTATWDLDTFGLANGLHALSVADCNLNGCGSAAAQNVDVQNAAPALTSPTADQVVQVTLDVAASAAGGGVRFLVDGVVKAFDSTAPFEVPVDISALLDGPHSVTAVGCNAAGTACSGPSSVVSFTVDQLHPTIPSLLGSFSPNGDGRVDLQKVVVRLPDTESVAWQVLTSTGTLVRGPITLGNDLPAGDHALTWNGRNNSGAIVANGWYKVVVSTTAGAQQGQVSRSFRLDTVAPTMTSVVGSGGSVYPVVDGFRDTVKLGVTVNEAASIDVRVKTLSGSVVRYLKASRSSAGALSVLWSGRNTSGALVPAGTYYVYFTSRDGAQNYRTIGAYKVVVSWKKLVAKSVALKKSAGYAYAAGAYSVDENGDDLSQPCASFADTDTAMYLSNWCMSDGDPPTYGAAAAYYRFTLPAATVYTSLRFEAYGFSDEWSEVTGTAYNWVTANDDSLRQVTASPTPHWQVMSTPAVTNHVKNRVVEFGVVLRQSEVGPAAEYGMYDVRVIVAYKILV